MSNKTPVQLLSLLLLLSTAEVYAQSTMNLTTLFTTRQERQIIDGNRYRSEQKSPVKLSLPNKPKPLEIRERVMEEHDASYKISGISLSADGPDTVWVNDQALENGATLEDGSRVNINQGKNQSVTITTPDGKRHTGVSGETLDVTYKLAAGVVAEKPVVDTNDEPAQTGAEE